MELHADRLCQRRLRPGGSAPIVQEMAETAVEPVRRALHAFARRDLGALVRELASDVIWSTPGRRTIAGEFRGRAAVAGYLRQAIALTGDTVRLVPVDLLVGGELVAVVLDVHGRRGGQTLEQRAVQVFRVRDGLIAERRLYLADEGAWDAFWGAPGAA